jgi:hypothetical protein
LQEQSATPKSLLRMVYIMGIVLVLLFLLFVGALIWKVSNGKAAPVPSVDVDLGLQGTAVKHTELDNGQLLISTESELIVVDVSKKRIVLRVKTK